MLFLLDANVRTVKWNGIPLHEASSAIVKEETNSDFYLTVRYPITDSGIYQLIKEDMLIKAPTPVLGAQLFRIKKPIENDDSLDITAYHVSDDIMKRSITPVSVVDQGCAIALSQMVQNAKTDLGDYSFTSDIMDSRTFNTTETETLYSVLMDGKHSIVGTWEGELVRDNFALSIKRSRGADRGVVITTHKNLKSYQRTKNSHGVVTRIHARSTFKPDGAEDEVTLRVTVDSPLINSYPYINEKEYENNNAETVEDLRKWAEAKFTNEGIDKASDAIEIEAYELDGQIVHLGDTVNLKSRKHNVDVYKKAVAYEFNCLANDGKGEYISITFDDKPGVGGSGVSSGLSNAADAILGAGASAQEVAIERAIRNANQAFDAEFDKRVEEINDGIELAKVKSEEYAENVRNDVESKIEEVTRQLTDEQAELEKRNQAKLDAFRDELANFNFDEDRINELIKSIDVTKAFEDVKAEIDKTFADVKSQIMAVSETSRVNAEMIGNDGVTRYNKNLVMDGTSRKIPFDGRATVRANDGGFKRGKTYTISFEALCQMMAKVAVSLTQSHAKLIQATFTDPNGKFPTVTHEMTSSPSSVELYPYPYTVNLTGPWYKSKTLSVNPSETTTLDLALDYREIADGNLEAEIIGTWAEEPEIIFDGGSG
ncbi:phage tail spike protein [Streptococcus moroccensis]|uniref:Phage minor structural protein n=1 Tax=Streptococcus moroccensis TaxID=1451356 RepID=A0ABT9YPQ7_9STRE|nr:phage tail spike protein [Streptococcus moroccensis]MDQ0221980.1 phage minor structural protein [Streptococcus moroccensis]